MDVTCQHCVGVMLDYLEGELPPHEQASVHRHIQACPPCLEFVHQYRASSTLAQKAMATDLPPNIMDRLSAFLHKNAK